MDELLLALYADVAAGVLDAASWVLDRYIGLLEWLDARWRWWQATHIVRVGPLRVKFGQTYMLVYSLRRPLLRLRWGWLGRFARHNGRGDDGD